jgi:hypothetical protein
VLTRREGKEHVVVNIIMSRFIPNKPGELRSPEPRESTCMHIRGPLKVKAPR